MQLFGQTLWHFGRQLIADYSIRQSNYLAMSQSVVCDPRLNERRFVLACSCRWLSSFFGSELIKYFTYHTKIFCLFWTHRSRGVKHSSRRLVVRSCSCWLRYCIWHSRDSRSFSSIKFLFNFLFIKISLHRISTPFAAVCHWHFSLDFIEISVSEFIFHLSSIILTVNLLNWHSLMRSIRQNNGWSRSLSCRSRFHCLSEIFSKEICHRLKTSSNATQIRRTQRHRQPQQLQS